MSRFALFLICLFIASASTAAGSSNDYEKNPAFQKKIAEARKEHKFDFASADYRKANEIAGGRCEKCMRAAMNLSLKARDYKQVIKMAQQQEALPGISSKNKAAAETAHAMALLQQSEHPSERDLMTARALLKKSIVESPNHWKPRYQLGIAEAMLGHTAAASEAFDDFLKHATDANVYRLRAMRFAEHPEEVLLPHAPPFSVTDNRGNRISLDALRGHVVVIDFWRTTCSICQDAIPVFNYMLRKHAADPLVILSVSSDKDTFVWKHFIEQHGMGWPQYQDTKNSLFTLFHVRGMPHYVVVDADGIMREHDTLTKFDIASLVDKLIAEARQGDAEDRPDADGQ